MRRSPNRIEWKGGEQRKNVMKRSDIHTHTQRRARVQKRFSSMSGMSPFALYSFADRINYLCRLFSHHFVVSEYCSLRCYIILHSAQKNIRSYCIRSLNFITLQVSDEKLLIRNFVERNGIAFCLPRQRRNDRQHNCI